MANSTSVVVSSTIFPDPELQAIAGRALMEPDARLSQTIQTVAALRGLGYTNILILDNSGQRWKAGSEKLLEPARVQLFEHFQFQNKGISELFSLLSGIHVLPRDLPIVKLSGRYIASKRLEAELGTNDFVVKYDHVGSKAWRSISTVSYAVKDRVVYEKFLKRVLREAYAYQGRIFGFRSFLRIALNAFHIRLDFPYESPIIQLEMASALVLRREGYRIKSVDDLGITGICGETGIMMRC